MSGGERRGETSSRRRRAVSASARHRVIVALVAVAGIATLAGCDGRERAGAREAARPAPSRERPRLESTLPPPAGRAVSPGDPRAVAAAQAFLRDPVQREACGPYALITESAAARRAEWVSLCAAIAEPFEAEYTRRLGVPLHHPPAGTIVLFSERSRFRAYAASDPALPGGYAGFSLAAWGLVALPVGDIAAEEIARTLAHELAHLAHRRAFGVELPPWLAEGLADAVGDSAGPAGFAPFEGFAGVEGIRRRLLLGYRAGQAESLERLVSLDRDRFDRGTVSYDYEQSALFVRFLLLDGGYGPSFRQWLVTQTYRRGEPAPDLPAALGSNWPELERRFRDWLGLNDRP